MALERSDPIPPGYYYIDLLTDFQRQTYSDWIRAVNTMSGGPRVKDVKNEGTMKVFHVLKQVPRWGDSAGLGFPSIAPYGEKTSLDDVFHTPTDTPSVLDQIEDFTDDIPAKAGMTLGLAAATAIAIPTVIVGSLLWAISRIGK